MSLLTRTVLFSLLPVIALRAATTTPWEPVWDTGANTATYGATVSEIALSFIYPTAVNLSQFSAGAAATAEGVGTAQDYTLTRAVLTMNGSVVGSITFQNNGVDPVSPIFTVAGSSYLTYGAASTGYENYSASTPLGTFNQGEGGSINGLDIAGTGPGSALDFSSSLEAFLGTGTIAANLHFPVNSDFDNEGTVWTSTVALSGLADVSITYYYDYNPVPEPSSFALLGLGCAAILARRRMKRVAHRAPSAC